MRQSAHGRREFLAAGLAALTLAGGDKPPKKPQRETIILKVEETVGHLAKVQQGGDLPVQGVGLVVGLDGTGSEAEPGMYRQKLLDEMRKRRVPNAERWLSSPMTSLVLAKTKIPPGVTPTDRLDVEIELTPASSTSSLAGGQLIRVELHQIGVDAKSGAEHEGQGLAYAYGPVMVDPKNPKVGRILGGARVKKESPFALVIDNKRRSVHTADLLQKVINQRFNQLKGIEQQGMASAKSDQFLLLSVPPRYHGNPYRYFQVVENLPLVSSESLFVQRKEKWGQELLDPKAAGASAIKLEGLGRNAIDVLKAGVASPNPQVRFFAAEALAYLNDESGCDVLADSAIHIPAFRAKALDALAALDQPAASIRLRELMAHPEVEVRYGAFNALRIQSSGTDHALGRVRVMREVPEPEDEEGDAMALRLGVSPRKRAERRPDPFELYVVDCEGPPLIHLANTRRCEVVVFGRSAKLLTPAVLGHGAFLINAAGNDALISVSRISAGQVNGEDVPDAKVEVRPELGAVITEAANLGASYPEVVSLLLDAESHKNLPGPLVVDAIPENSPEYDRAQVAGVDATAKKDPAVSRASGQAPKKAPAPRRGLMDRLRNRGK